MSEIMRQLKITNYDKLKELLESREMYKHYRKFVSGDVKSANVMEYPHNGGAEIEGRNGKWWVFVRVLYGDNDVYDVALWKLGSKVLSKLTREGVIKITDEEKTNRKIAVSN